MCCIELFMLMKTSYGSHAQARAVSSIGQPLPIGQPLVALTPWPIQLDQALAAPMRQALPAHVTMNCTHGDNHGDLQHRENVLAAFNFRFVSISTITLCASRRGQAEGCKGVHLKLSLVVVVLAPACGCGCAFASAYMGSRVARAS